MKPDFPFVKFDKKDIKSIKNRVKSNLTCDCCSKQIKDKEGTVGFYGYSTSHYDPTPYIVHEKCNKVFEFFMSHVYDKKLICWTKVSKFIS